MTTAFNQILTITKATGKLKADGIPASLIDQLSDEEKVQVEEILVKMVQTNDLTGIEALAALRTDKAVQTLKNRYDITNSDSILKIRLAKLLWEATSDPGYIMTILRDFKPKSHADKLTLISIYLELPPETVPNERYIDIIRHEDYQPMRFRAAKGLLYNLKILPHSTDVTFGDPLHNLLRKLSDNDPQTREAALREVKGL